MRFTLRAYQSRCLDEFQRYLDAASRPGAGAKLAFLAQVERPYHTVPGLPDIPYVCVRVPTGGGKTVMAAHAVGIATRSWLGTDRSVCLWLVPSNAIREQTLGRLRTIGDPYRDAVTSRLGKVTVMDLAEALYVQRSALDGGSAVIVTTLQALRVADTEGRKVYDQAGALQHHFTGLAPEQLARLERRENGTPVESLANVLRLRRPIVIMDEAHNARTPLTFDTLTRVDPSCIIEFTATPETTHNPDTQRFASNVLTHVSAAALKAEEMVKLPIKLLTRPAWTDAVADAVAKQQDLERVAVREAELTGERLRPIVLLQAQPRRQGRETITVEVLKKSLIDDHHVPEDQIAVATGATRELDGVDLNDPGCPIRYIITVAALREGWDCPTAYILCSVAEQAGATAVEQILGRVLRLPGARRKRLEALNYAYAFVVSPRFVEAANALRDALIDNGFERFEAATVIEEAGAQPSFFGATAAAPIRMKVSEPLVRPLLSTLLPDVSYDKDAGVIIIVAPLSDSQEEALAESFTSPVARAEVHEAARASREGPIVPRPDHVLAPPLLLPQLAIRRAGVLELFEETHLLEIDWHIAQCDASLNDQEFSSTLAAGSAGEVDVNQRGEVQFTTVEQLRVQLAMLEGEGGWTDTSLVRWLDAQIPHRDLTQEEVQVFLHKALVLLLERRGVTIDKLARDKHRLRRALEARIDIHRAEQRRRAYQQVLFEGASGEVVVDPSLVVEIGTEHRYAANWYYEGPYVFQKHLFRHVGELKSEGEEFGCAVYIDEHPLVDRWVRNLSRLPASFSLQTSTDRFYSDFVGRLTDGRHFAVESKGEQLWSNEDSKEKRSLGELWAARSHGRCVFVMPKGADWAAIDRAFRA